MSFYIIECIFDLGNIISWPRFEVVNFDIIPVEKQGAPALFWLRMSYHVQRYCAYRPLLTQSFNIVNTPIISLFSKKWVPVLTDEDNIYIPRQNTVRKSYKMQTAWTTHLLSSFLSCQVPIRLGGQRQHRMRSMPHASTHDRHWKSNPRPFDLKSAPLHSAMCSIHTNLHQLPVSGFNTCPATQDSLGKTITWPYHECIMIYLT